MMFEAFWKKLSPFTKKFQPKIGLDFLMGYEANPVSIGDKMNTIYAPTFQDANGRNVSGKLQWAILESFHVFESVTPDDYWTWDYATRCQWQKKLSDILVKEVGLPERRLGNPPSPGLDRYDVAWEKTI